MYAVMHGDHVAFYLFRQMVRGEQLRASNVRWTDGSVAVSGQSIRCNTCGMDAYQWDCVRAVLNAKEVPSV